MYYLCLVIRIIINIKSFDRDFCLLKNILNRIRKLGGNNAFNCDLCEYKNKKLHSVTNSRPDDIIITNKTSWKEIEKLII